MPVYTPFICGISFETVMSCLCTIDWNGMRLTATFDMPNKPGQAIQIRFTNDTIVRMVSEFPFCTEEDGPVEGIVPGHFAYLVDGASFADTQSKRWKESERETYGAEVKHYRFLTGELCLDVLSAQPPEFCVVTLVERI